MLDVGRLHPLPVDAQLRVEPAEELHHAVRALPAPVAGPEHPDVRQAPGIGPEPVTGQLRLAEVPEGDLGTADGDLTGLVDRRPAHPPIEDEELGAADAGTDRGRVELLGQVHQADPLRRLGGAVQGDPSRGGAQGPCGGGHVRSDRGTAQREQPHVRQFGVTVPGRGPQHPGHGRGQVQHGDPFGSDPVQQPAGYHAHLLRRQAGRRPERQRQEEFAQQRIVTQSREDGEAVPCGERERLRVPPQEPQNGFRRAEHGVRPPGGTRGERDVGRLRRQAAGRQRRVGRPVRQSPGQLGTGAAVREVRRPAERTGEPPRGRGRGCRPPQPPVGMLRIQHGEGGAGLPHAQ